MLEASSASLLKNQALAASFAAPAHAAAMQLLALHALAQNRLGTFSLTFLFACTDCLAAGYPIPSSTHAFVTCEHAPLSRT